MCHILDSIKKELCCGVVLVGAPGTGKTAVVQAISNEYNLPIFSLEGDLFGRSVFNDFYFVYAMFKFRKYSYSIYLGL